MPVEFPKSGLAFLPIVFFFLLLAGDASGLIAQSSAAGDAQPAPDPSARLNALGHKLLEAAQRANGLTGAEQKPWHLKVDYQMLRGANTQKPVSGSMEEWYAGPFHWRRSHTSAEPRWSGSEWQISRIERYTAKDGRDDFEDYWMTLRVARPVVSPLYQIANIKASDQLTVRRVDTAGIGLNCVSLSEFSAAEHGRKPEWFIPTMCFDSDMHLRLIHSEETVVQFEDIQPFAGRAVARDVKIIFNGTLSAEMKVTRLEGIDSVSDDLLKPSSKASLRPYVIEPGYPRPVSVYEVGAHIPLMNSGTPFRGTLLVPVFINKDGTVRLQHAASASPMQAVFDAVFSAVSRWKFQPYLVDGQPVEVDYDVPYEVDGKPFVPSYERKNAEPGDAGPHIGANVEDDSVGPAAARNRTSSHSWH